MRTTLQRLQQLAYRWIEIYATPETQAVAEELEKQARRKNFFVALYICSRPYSLPCSGIQAFVDSNEKVLRDRKSIKEFIENHTPVEHWAH